MSLDERLFYTLRDKGDPERPFFELAKWSEDRVRPLEVYTQWIAQRSDNTYSVHSCNCPSRSNPCKHASISLSLLEQGIENLPHFFHNGSHIMVVEDL